LTFDGLFERALSRRRLMGLATVGALAGALPLGRAAAAGATAGPPRLPDVVRVRDAAGGTSLVGLEEYLKGVVPAEMPHTWPMEALKAQAVAARTYLAARVATEGDICSSTSCQVWNPAKRHPRGDAAVDATSGELLTYGGGMIWSYYSSTCGGQTASSALPYCQSVRCWQENGGGASAADLSNEAAASAFWAADSRPSAFCAGSPAYRWGWTVDRDDLAALLDRLLGSTSEVAPRYQSGTLGDLDELAVVARGISGKATKLRVAGDSAWTVSGEMNIRSLLRSSRSAPILRSANVVLALAGDTLTGRGGGAGHGMGMCQHGARGMAERGLDYHAILTHYYRDVAFVTL
jgi:stage II sporulation protein D